MLGSRCSLEAGSPFPRAVFPLILSASHKMVTDKADEHLGNIPHALHLLDKVVEAVVSASVLFAVDSVEIVAE